MSHVMVLPSLLLCCLISKNLKCHTFSLPILTFSVLCQLCFLDKFYSCVQRRLGKSFIDFLVELAVPMLSSLATRVSLRKWHGTVPTIWKTPNRCISSPAKKWIRSLTLTICYLRLVLLQVQNWPRTSHIHQPHTRREWAFLEKRARVRQREAQSVHRYHKQIVTLAVGTVSYNYMFTLRELGGFGNITMFIWAN